MIQREGVSVCRRSGVKVLKDARVCVRVEGCVRVCEIGGVCEGV